MGCTHSGEYTRWSIHTLEYTTPYLRGCTGEAGISGFCSVVGVRISFAVATNACETWDFPQRQSERIMVATEIDEQRLLTGVAFTGEEFTREKINIS